MASFVLYAYIVVETKCIRTQNRSSNQKNTPMDGARGTSILGEVRNVEISGPTQQLLCSEFHDFLAIFALHSTLKNESNCMIF